MISDDIIKELSYAIPKAELHMHLEGSFEPELMFELAKRNNLTIPYKSIDEVKEKYKFNNLKEFLDIYYQSCSVLITKEDFHDLAYSFVKRSAAQGLKYVEPFNVVLTYIYMTNAKCQIWKFKVTSDK